MNKGFAFFMEQGCGKTLASIATMGTMYQKGLIKRVLIVAPTSVCSVWPHELLDYADFQFHAALIFGDRTKRLKALSELMADKESNLLVAVINYESTWRPEIFDALMEYDADLIIADESQRIKSHDKAQSKAMHKLGDKARYKLALSGTPVQNNAIDIYSQYRFLDSSVFGTNFYSFRNKYAVMGGFNRKQIIGHKCLDDLIKKEYSIAYRVTKEEALDLPEKVFESRYIEMTPDEMKLYKQIKKESYAELSEESKITATTVLTKLLRLQQFTGGFLMPDGAIRPMMIGSGKIDALSDILDDFVLTTHKKLVIFARFRAEIDIIKKLLEKKKITYGCIFGDIKLADRGDIVDDFQNNPETMVFLAQIDTAGLGITLTAADTCVYYSKNFNYAAYEQSLARIHRIGQRNKCTYIDLITTGTVDEMINKALHKKEDLAKTIVDDWRKYFEG